MAGSIPCTSAGFAELSAAILRAGKALRFRAHGDSMVPLVRDGDEILVAPVEPAALRAGDVVLCSSAPGRVVVHRVVRRLAGPEGPRFTVQGDAVSRPDGTFGPGQVYGRVVAIERRGARISLEGPALRALGGLAVVRSRWQVGRGRGFRWAGRILRRVPGLSRYLA